MKAVQKIQSFHRDARQGLDLCQVRGPAHRRHQGMTRPRAQSGPHHFQSQAV